MLFHLFFAARGLSIAHTLRVRGYLPDVFTSRSGPLVFTPLTDDSIPHSLTLIESSFWDESPSNKDLVCHFSSRLPTDFQLLQSSLPGQTSVSISPEVHGAFSIAEALFRQKIQTFLFPTNATFLILPSGSVIPPNYTARPLSETALKFLSTAKTHFRVFASQEAAKSAVADRLCHITPRYGRPFFFVLPVLLVIVCVWFRFWRRFTLPPQRVKLWVFGANREILFGPPAASVLPIDWQMIAQCTDAATLKRQTVTRVARMDGCDKCQRVVAVPMKNGLVLAALFNEIFPEPVGSEVECPFVFECEQIIGKPRLLATGDRSAPVRLEFTLPDHVACVADLPPSVLVPFQPAAEALIMVNALAAELETVENDFTEQFARCCRLIDRKSVG
jgi:hypothetical protein